MSIKQTPKLEYTNLSSQLTSNWIAYQFLMHVTTDFGNHFTICTLAVCNNSRTISKFTIVKFQIFMLLGQ